MKARFCNPLLVTKHGQIVDFEAPLFLDVCKQNRAILNGVEILIKAYQSADEFRLFNVSGETYQVEIVDCFFRACHIKLDPAAVVGINEQLKRSPAIYPLMTSSQGETQVQSLQTLPAEQSESLRQEIRARLMLSGTQATYGELRSRKPSGHRQVAAWLTGSQMALVPHSSKPTQGSEHLPLMQAVLTSQSLLK